MEYRKIIPGSDFRAFTCKLLSSHSICNAKITLSAIHKLNDNLFYSKQIKTDKLASDILITSHKKTPIAIFTN